MAENIKFIIDGQANFAPIYQQLAVLKAEIKSINEQSSKFSVSNSMLTGLKNAESQFRNTVSSINGFRVETVQAADAVDHLTQKMLKSQYSVGQYFSSWRQSTKGVIPELKAIADQNVRLQESMVIPSSVKKGYADVVTYQHQAVNANQAMQEYQKVLNTHLMNGATKLIDFGKNTQWAGRQLMVGFTVPLLAAGGALATMFYQVDQSMKNLLSVYDVGGKAGGGFSNIIPSQQELDGIKKGVMDVAKQMASLYGQSAQETVGVAADLAAAGYTQQQLLDMTKVTSTAMVLGETDRQSAIKATIALQTAYRLSSQDTGTAMAFFSAAQAATSTTMKDLIDAIPRVGPIIKNLGGDYKETTALLVAMKEGGVAAGEGANALKFSFQRIISPTKSASDLLKTMGINLKDIAESGDPILMIEKLQSALAKLSPLARQQAITELFGKLQAARMTALLDNFNKSGTQSAKVMEMMGLSAKQLSDIQQHQIDVRQQSTSQQFAQSIENLKASILPIGEEFLKVITPIVNGVTTIVNLFNKLGPMKYVILGAFAGAAIIGPIIMMTGLFANMAGQLFKITRLIKMFGQGMREVGSGSPLSLIKGGVAGLGNYFERVDLAEKVSKELSDSLSQSLADQEKNLALYTKALSQYTNEIQRLMSVSSRANINPPYGPFPPPSGGPLPPPSGGGSTPPFIPTIGPNNAGMVIGEASRTTNPLILKVETLEAGKIGIPGENQGIAFSHMRPDAMTREGSNVLGIPGYSPSSNAMGNYGVVPGYMVQRGRFGSLFNERLGDQGLPIVPPSMMNEETLRNILLNTGHEPDKINSSLLQGARRNLSLENISTNEAGKLSMLRALGEMNAQQIEEFKRMSRGADSAKIEAFLKQTLGQKWDQISQQTANEVISLYTVAEKDAEEAFARSGRVPSTTFERLSLIGSRYSELLSERYLAVLGSFDESLRDSFIIHTEKTGEALKSAVNEGMKTNIGPKLVNIMASSESIGQIIVTAFDHLISVAQSSARNIAEALDISSTGMATKATTVAAEISATKELVRPSISVVPMPKIASGGKISGPGGPKDDKIPALLSNGEYVVNAGAVNHYGSGFMDSINSKKLANGGIAKFSQGTGKFWGLNNLWGASGAENLFVNQLSQNEKLLAKVINEVNNSKISTMSKQKILSTVPFNLNPKNDENFPTVEQDFAKVLKSMFKKGMFDEHATPDFLARLFGTIEMPNYRKGFSPLLSDRYVGPEPTIEQLTTYNRAAPSWIKTISQKSALETLGIPQGFEIDRRALAKQIVGTLGSGYSRSVLKEIEDRLANSYLRTHTTHGWATGGNISGPGGPKDDMIPAMLSNGEYVVNADAVKHYGVGFINSINAKKLAAGGTAGGGFHKGRYYQYHPRKYKYADGGIAGFAEGTGSGNWTAPTGNPFSQDVVDKALKDQSKAIKNSTEEFKKHNIALKQSSGLFGGLKKALFGSNEPIYGPVTQAQAQAGQENLGSVRRPGMLSPSRGFQSGMGTMMAGQALGAAGNIVGSNVEQNAGGPTALSQGLQYGATGMSMGSMFGPWGMAIGAVGGAIIGGVMGHIAEQERAVTAAYEAGKKSSDALIQSVTMSSTAMDYFGVKLKDLSNIKIGDYSAQIDANTQKINQLADALVNSSSDSEKALVSQLKVMQPKDAIKTLHDQYLAVMEATGDSQKAAITAAAWAKAAGISTTAIGSAITNWQKSDKDYVKGISDGGNNIKNISVQVNDALKILPTKIPEIFPGSNTGKTPELKQLGFNEMPNVSGKDIGTQIGMSLLQTEKQGWASYANGLNSMFGIKPLVNVNSKKVTNGDEGVFAVLKDAGFFDQPLPAGIRWSKLFNVKDMQDSLNAVTGGDDNFKKQAKTGQDLLNASDQYVAALAKLAGVKFDDDAYVTLDKVNKELKILGNNDISAATIDKVSKSIQDVANQISGPIVDAMKSLSSKDFSTYLNNLPDQIKNSVAGYARNLSTTGQLIVSQILQGINSPEATATWEKIKNNSRTNVSQFLQTLGLVANGIALDATTIEAASRMLPPAFAKFTQAAQNAQTLANMQGSGGADFATAAANNVPESRFQKTRDSITRQQQANSDKSWSLQERRRTYDLNYKKQTEPLSNDIKHQQDVINGINKEIQARQKVADEKEKERQRDLQLANLRTDVARAMNTGDLLELAKAQSSYNAELNKQAEEKAKEKKDKEDQAKIDAAQAKIDTDQKKLDTLQKAYDLQQAAFELEDHALQVDNHRLELATRANDAAEAAWNKTHASATDTSAQVDDANTTFAALLELMKQKPETWSQFVRENLGLIKRLAKDTGLSVADVESRLRPGFNAIQSFIEKNPVLDKKGFAIRINGIVQSTIRPLGDTLSEEMKVELKNLGYAPQLITMISNKLSTDINEMVTLEPKNLDVLANLVEENGITYENGQMVVKAANVTPQIEASLKAGGLIDHEAGGQIYLKDVHKIEPEVVATYMPNNWSVLTNGQIVISAKQIPAEVLTTLSDKGFGHKGPNGTFVIDKPDQVQALVYTKLLESGIGKKDKAGNLHINANQINADVAANLINNGFAHRVGNEIVINKPGYGSVNVSANTDAASEDIRRLNNKKITPKLDPITSGFDKILTHIGWLVERQFAIIINNAIKTLRNIPGLGGLSYVLVDGVQYGGAATGGLITGPGGPTSDSIPTMLSNGEYVIKAAAVAKYGPKFFDAVNSGTYMPNVRVPSGAVNYSAAGNKISSMSNGDVNYNVSVNVAGTNASADEIANVVIKTLKQRQNANSTFRTI